MMNKLEKETDDVYEILLDTDSTEELMIFIRDLEKTYPDMSFGEHYRQYLDNFREGHQTLARLSQIDKDYIYQIINGKRRPDRDKVIALCLAIGMTDRECTRCLERSNYGILYPKISGTQSLYMHSKTSCLYWSLTKSLMNWGSNLWLFQKDDLPISLQ